MAQFGILKVLILKTLSEESLNGNQIIKNIKSRTGIKFSCGSLYPMLSHLIKLGMIIAAKEKAQTIYYLTKKGKDLIKNSSKKQKEIIDKIHELLNLLKILEGDSNEIEEIKEKLSNIKIDCFLAHEKLIQLRDELFHLDFSKNKKEVENILGDTIEKLKKLRK